MGRNNRALITGLFLITLITAATAVVFWIGNFERERNIYVVSTRESVSGLNPESTVFYRGIAVGKVLKVAFDPNDSGVILVPIEVDKNIVLTRSVFATLRYKGVTGLTEIELKDSGNITEPLLPGEGASNRIPLVPSLTDKLMNTGEDLLKKAEHLMGRLSVLLNEENEKNIRDILGNLKTLSDKLYALQAGVDKALAGIPKLTDEASLTLEHINGLTKDLQVLSQEVRSLSKKANNLADSGKTVGDVVTETTLPKINQLLSELQSTSSQVKRVAEMLENEPQSLLLGPDRPLPGPGEPGYEEPR